MRSTPRPAKLPPLSASIWRRAAALVLLAAGSAAHAEPADRFDPAFAAAPESTTAAAPTRHPTGLRERASDLVISAMNFIGVRYQRGGSHIVSGFDCSGFTRHVFQLSLGLVLPRRVDDQARAEFLIPVDKAELLPGDLVFFNTLARSFSHVGIYVGEGRFIHAPRSGSDVRIESLRHAYWAQRYTGARRAALTEPGGRDGLAALATARP